MLRELALLGLGRSLFKQGEEHILHRGLLGETMVVAVGEFGRSPLRGLSTSGNNNDADGRDHWPYCYTALAAGGGVRRGLVYGRSDSTSSGAYLDYELNWNHGDDMDD